jgi:hypothetical protein
MGFLYPPGKWAQGSLFAGEVSEMNRLSASEFAVQPGDGSLLADVQNDVLPGGSLAVVQPDDGEHTIAARRAAGAVTLEG